MSFEQQQDVREGKTQQPRTQTTLTTPAAIVKSVVVSLLSEN